MRSLLHFNPDKRSTAEDGCRHAYCKRFANEGQELKLSRDIIPPLDDDVQLTASEYRIKLYEDIVARKAANKKRAKTELCENMQAAQLSESPAPSPDSRRKSSVDNSHNQSYNSQTNHQQQQPREEPVQYKQEQVQYKQDPVHYSTTPYYPATSYAPQAPYAPTAPYATTPTAAASNNYPDHGPHYRAKSAGVVEDDGAKHYKTKSHLSQQQQQQQLRSHSAGVGAQRITKPETKYNSHGNHGKPEPKYHGNSGNYGNNGPDLTVCSSRMVPNNRSPAKAAAPVKAGKRSVGGPQGNPHMPPRYGSSTHQHGTVTKDNLSALKSRQWL